VDSPSISTFQFGGTIIGVIIGRFGILPVRMGMSELNISHWIFHAPFDFFETFIHLPWHGMKGTG
jgi:hypothetical protein